MKSTLSTMTAYLAGFSAMALIATSPAFAGASEHTHEGHGNHAVVRKADAGKKWPTDQVLRTSMDNIREAMAASREDIAHEKLGAADYGRLARTVDSNVNNIVQNCKLTPEADAAFHEAVLKDLASGSEIMRGSSKVEAQRAGALAVLQALRNYEQYFEHPGWNGASIK